MTRSSSPAAGTGELLPGLLRLVSASRPDADTQLISLAYDVAAYWHQGQKRKSGDSYITHPVAVAEILARVGADDPTVCAALLHDVVEDTPYTLAALKGKFGAEIADLVGAAMRLDTEQVAAAYADSAAAVTLAADERVLLLKVADRLHNMRTIRHVPRAKQVLKSRQTLEGAAPLARALQMEAISSELEDLASGALRRHGRRPGTASGSLLTASAALLPAAARARWREEWLAELHTLPTRRDRLAFAAQVVLGIGRLALALYQPASALKKLGSAVLATAVTASTLAVGGWKVAAALVAAAIAGLAAVMWILHSEDRTARLARLISAIQNTQRSHPAPRTQDPETGHSDQAH
jgi:hypothetical protein